MRVVLSAFGLYALARGFERVPAIAKEELLVAAKEATLLLEADVVGNYPKHTGLTRASIASDAFATPTGVLGVVGSSAPVAVFLELGTKPHFPPIEPLLAWVRDVLGKSGPAGEAAARGIQRKIGKKGTPAKPLFAQALQRNQATIARMFESAAARIAQRMGGLGEPGGAA